MTTRSEVLTLARSQIGYAERGNNITKYWAELKPGFQGAPWCAAFVIWVYKQLGSDLLLTGPSAPYYTPSMEAWAKKTGRWKASKDCLPGDVLIFGGSGGAVHTGILEKQDGANHVIAIEGNTSKGSSGSQTNGGGVYRRRRPRSWIRGCISMASEVTITSGGGGTSASIPGRPAGPERLAEDGELGPKTLAALERYLQQKQDGTFDRGLVRAVQSWVGTTRTGKLSKADVQALQRKVSAVVDGDWGPNTTFGLQRFLNRRNGYAVT